MGMLHGDFDVVEEAPPQAVAAPSPPRADAAEQQASGAPPREASSGKARSLARYIVVSGDSPWRIAFKLYRDGTRWREIVAANPGFDFRRLQPGHVLQVPSPAIP